MLRVTCGFPRFGCWPLVSPGPQFGIDEAFVANIKSQIKRNKQNETARLRNKAVRSELRTRIKAAEAAAAVNAEDADDKFRTAVTRIDMAATKGVIHKNAAARSKSRLAARVKRSAAEATETAAE
jgi:small subunit ribosomal protein S20